MQGSRAWLAVRALFAVLFTLAFYAMALCLAGALALGGWSIFDASSRDGGDFRLGILAFLLMGMSLVLLLSLLPRRQKFAPPGPELRAEDQPELFAEITSLAKATDQEPPALVYAGATVNAAVFRAGGFAGVGATRRMVIGLPLLAGLTVSEARAVLAHEFGHYYSGDLALGPWIHRTRTALGRTIATLGTVASDGSRLDWRIGLFASLVRAPFLGYAFVFGRLTYAISRRQETVADALAARIAGKDATARALVQVARADALFPMYVQREVSPIASRGFLPPVGLGFARFLTSSVARSEEVRAAVERALARQKADPYDSHPPTRERVAAIEALPPPGGPPAADDSRPAITLLRGVDALERGMFRPLNSAKLESFLPISWEETGAKALIGLWREQYAPWASAFAGTKIDHVAGVLAKPPLVPLKTDPRSFRMALASAVALTFCSVGFTIENAPGEELAFVREGLRITPFPLFGRLGDKNPPLAEWAALVEQAGIAGRDLGHAT